MRPDRATKHIRVLIVDDHAVVREGIRHVLSTDEGLEVVGEASDGGEALVLVDRFHPDVVVLDLSMPGISGLEVVAKLRTDVPDTKVLVLSIHDQDEYVLESLRAGAHGYLRKDSSPAEIRSAIRRVFEGGSVFSPDVARQISSALQNERAQEERQQKIAQLSAREREVLVEIAKGATSKEIAGRLGISPRTVESHREALTRKLGIRGVAGLTRLAIDLGLIIESAGAGVRTTTEE
jgi:DNA-binding NarL/FixJ family response regulator